MSVELDPATFGALRLHIADLSPRQRVLAVARAGGIEGVACASKSQLVPVLDDDAAVRLACVTREHVEQELARMERGSVALVTREHERWPPLLREIADPPWALWVRGELPDPALPAVAIVGTRKPTAYGTYVTEWLAKGLAAEGLVIVSGGAAGVDGQAHAAALEAGAPTVAVLGCGVDVAYPRSHRALFDRMACDGGAVVSEHPCGTQPRPHHFPVRNRLLAGWSKAVLITEATRASGSLITARLAVDADRDVLAVPGEITSPASEGTNWLIVDGAWCVRSVDDVMEALGLERRLALPEGVASDADDPVLALLPPGRAVGLDDLLARAGLPAGELLARLIQWEARGRVNALAGGGWMLAAPRAR